MRNDLIGYVNSKNQVNLENFYVISCQHYLESNKKMIFSLIKKGVLPRNIFMINKTYSYNSKIGNEFKKKGIRCFNYKYDSHKAFDSQFKKAIKSFIKKIKKEIDVNQEIILIDDGGEVISIANKILKKRQIYAVEQTSSGFHKLKKLKLNFPIINIARSHAKLNYETPYIIEDFLKKLYSKLSQLKLKPRKTLIIGKGVLGNCLEKKMKFKADFYDITHEKEKLKNIIQNYDLIIGATGFTSIPRKLHKQLKKGCCLVSISSSDREFDAIYLRKKIPRVNNPHKDLQIDGITLLNNGFPLSFQGNRIEVPKKYMQLTMGLLLAGIYQSIKQNKRGIISLRKITQENIIKKFLEITHL
jgi:S-adenosylhomocysteine hydrolase